jgi:hypothetical protein
MRACVLRRLWTSRPAQPVLGGSAMPAAVDGITAATGVTSLSDHFEGWALGLRADALRLGGAEAVLNAAAPVFQDCTVRLDSSCSNGM